MESPNDTVTDSRPPEWREGSTPPPEELDFVQLNAAHIKAADEMAAAIARELNGPLTALLLYMGEIKHHSDRLRPGLGRPRLFAAGGGERAGANRAGLRPGQATHRSSQGRLAHSVRNRGCRIEWRPRAADAARGEPAVLESLGQAADQARARGVESDQRGLFE